MRYTRASRPREGLDQEFNSLHAQREAAEAYIASQRQQGWTLLVERYDDGGFSGGSLDRPALHRLLAAIQTGSVDCVVVYKVDRLSRSLLDFTRLMEQFERRSVNFVAVTQQFNTTTSLGRLTLNVLLSFAQFEREIIGERTRDKMSAARKKGKWIGGVPVLGYDVAPGGGRLVVNEQEAARVQEILQLYAEHKSLQAVLAKLEEREWKTKAWKSRRGLIHGGRKFAEPMLLRLLTNPIYVGQVKHHDEFLRGEHRPIVEASIWHSVNDELGSRSESDRIRTIGVRDRTPLRGLLYCGTCREPMAWTSTSRGERLYRYYVCRHRTCPTRPISAAVLEESVREQLRVALAPASARHRMGFSETDWAALGSCTSPWRVPEVVRRICYDGATGRVCLELSHTEGANHR